MVLGSVSNAPLPTMQSSKRNHGSSNPNNGGTNANNESHIRPTEAQLRWAQFHHKTRARAVKEQVDRLWQTPEFVKDVDGALSDDGASTSSEASDSSTKSAMARIKSRRPKISRGRRAVLKVSQRSYHQRSGLITEQGFQCVGDKENDKKEELVDTLKKPRRSTGALPKDEDRINRFEAAYAIMRNNVKPTSKPTIVRSTRRWTRPKNEDGTAVAVGTTNFQDWKWGIARRKRTANNKMNRALPFDRRASWLVHMPARESSIKRRYQYAQPLSSNGEFLEPVTLYEGAPAELLSPGQLKFDEMVSRLQEYDEAPIPEQNIVAVSARYLNQLPTSEPIESPRVVRRQKLYDMRPEEEEDEPLRVVRRPKNSIGTRYEQEVLQQPGDEEPLQIVRRTRDGTDGGARYEQEYLQGDDDDDQDDALRRRARVSTGARYEQAQKGNESMRASQRSRGSTGIGARHEDEYFQQHGEEDEDSLRIMRRARGTGSGARYEQVYLQQHREDDEEVLRIMRRARGTGSGARYEQEYLQQHVDDDEEVLRIMRRARGTGIGARYEQEHLQDQDDEEHLQQNGEEVEGLLREEEEELLRIVRRARGTGIGAQFEQEHLQQHAEDDAEALRIVRRARGSGIGAQYEQEHLRQQDDEEGDYLQLQTEGGSEEESLRVVRRAHGAGIGARYERDYLEQKGKVDEESLRVVRRARRSTGIGARCEQEQFESQGDEDEESLRIERRARGSIGDNYEQYLAQKNRRGRVSEAHSMGDQSIGSVDSDFFDKARRMHDTTPLDSTGRVSRKVSLGAIPESSDKQPPYSPMRTSVRGRNDATISTTKEQQHFHHDDHPDNFYEEDDRNLSHIYPHQEFDEKSKSAYSESGLLVSTDSHVYLDASSPQTPRSHVQSTTSHAYATTVSPKTPRTKSREGGALLDIATPTSGCGDIDGAGALVDPDSEMSKSSSFRMGAAKVAGGLFQRVTGISLASSDTGSEIRAVAAFRKTQKERGNINDGSSSSSSFRTLPEGIRRLVLGGAAPKPDSQQAADERSESYSFAEEQQPGLEHFNPSSYLADQMPPARSFSNRSAVGVSAMSPEHGKSLQQKIMEESDFLGDEDAEQTIIDTDDTTSDASGAKMDAAMAASLLLSPTILTKRHQQAIKSIERRSWEQVGYLLSANPWLAEMMEVTTDQYLLHKLALYGASKFLWSDENDAVDVVNAAPQALNQDIVDRFPSSVHKFDQDGNLPLHMAAASGNVEMAILLGERFPSGASVRNNDGMLPLHLAVQACAAPMANAHGDLIYGADFVALILQLFPGAVAVSDSEGDLPLHIAAAALEGDIGVDIIYLLLDEADRQSQRDGGLRFIENVKSKTDEDSVDDATIDTEAPTDSSNMEDDAMRCNMVRNEMGRTALTKAVESGSGWQVIEAIARGPGGVRAALLPDASKCNALHLLLSEEYGDPQAALSILKIAPESATARNAERMLPIEIACRTGMPEEVILAMVLVDTPVDLNQKDAIKAKDGFGGSWYFLTCESDDEYVHLVEEVISICSYSHLTELCYMKGGQNESGAPVISRATPMCRAALQEAVQMGESTANAADQLYTF